MRKQVISRWKAKMTWALLVVVPLLVCWLRAARLNPRPITAQPQVVSPVSVRNEASSEADAVPAAQPANENLTKLFPPSELPMVATEQGARTSLHYLAENGADLTRPMPSKHRVFAANAQIATLLADWGRANGFEIRGPTLVRSHTGQPQQTLELVRTEVPDPAQIEREGRLVLAQVQQTPGTYYQTWSGEIVR